LKAEIVASLTLMGIGSFRELRDLGVEALRSCVRQARFSASRRRTSRSSAEALYATSSDLLAINNVPLSRNEMIITADSAGVAEAIAPSPSFASFVWP
jgi:hypothetical protein